MFYRFIFYSKEIRCPVTPDKPNGPIPLFYSVKNFLRFSYFINEDVLRDYLNI